MKPQSGHDPLSLQEKLDRIAHDRDVLALLRELAHQGLKDGDAVVHRKDGSRGRLSVSRDRTHALVVQDDGTEVPFRRGEWMRSD
jgi:hypothetical protein